MFKKRALWSSFKRKQDIFVRGFVDLEFVEICHELIKRKKLKRESFYVAHTTYSESENEKVKLSKICSLGLLNFGW